MNLYPMELDEWQDRLYLESGDGVADLAVDVSECYDYDKGEWMEDELKGSRRTGEALLRGKHSNHLGMI